jgi:hypothetical protein
LVEGHTDDRGSDATNQQLSQKRADAVREYLESRGVPAERMRSVGRGESNPVASNDNPEGRANNRRVEIIVERASSNAQGARPSTAEDTESTEPAPASDPGHTPTTPLHARQR